MGGLFGNSNDQFFTPDVVVEFMVSLLDELNLLKNGVKILEPSCGSGNFLRVLEKKNKNLDITGIELVKELFDLCRICYPNMKIIQGDALDMIDKLEGQYDIVIGNPPFSLKVVNDKYKAAYDRSETFFVELAIRSLKEGGYGILILSNSLCSTNKFLKFRKWMIENIWPIALIDLPKETFYFSGTNVNTTIVFFRKAMKNVNIKDYDIMVAECNSIGWDYRGKKIDYKKELELFIELMGEEEGKKEFLKRYNTLDVIKQKFNEYLTHSKNVVNIA